jgi:hypothetical protein
LSWLLELLGWTERGFTLLIGWRFTSTEIILAWIYKWTCVLLFEYRLLELGLNVVLLIRSIILIVAEINLCGWNSLRVVLHQGW